MIEIWRNITPALKRDMNDQISDHYDDAFNSTALKWCSARQTWGIEWSSLTSPNFCLVGDAIESVYGGNIVSIKIDVDGTGEVVLEVRRLQKTDISSYQKRNRRTTAQQVANQFLAASGKQISRKTVARRLRGGRLYARRPVVCVPLTRQHRTARLQWCREHHNWTEQDWACVLFSDESRFSLSSD
ncbi:retrovirus-related Pol polyprotein from transposon 297 [Trichonephila clavipes]|nr:retrovirus-related Pol polyprotein from transposon 297 [Trichonephila clavipes]